MSTGPRQPYAAPEIKSQKLELGAFGDYGLDGGEVMPNLPHGVLDGGLDLEDG